MGWSMVGVQIQGEAMVTALGADIGLCWTWSIDVPQVTVDGRKVSAGRGAPEMVLCGVGCTKVGADVGIGDPVELAGGVMGGSTLRG